MISKKGDDILGIWSNRWFVLDGHVLRWFDDEEHYAQGKPQNGMLHLSDVISIHQWRKKPTLFHLQVAGRVYQLKCEQAADVKRWVGLIHFIGHHEDSSLHNTNQQANKF